MASPKPIPPLTPSQIERFWARVQVDSPGACWPWKGSMSSLGYGLFWRLRAHRVAYVLVKGAIPDGLMLDHLCRNKSCCNPDHLEAVTQRVNVLRGDSPSAQGARKTHCLRGHEFTPDNTNRRTGWRHCNQCQWDRDRARRQKRRRRHFRGVRVSLECGHEKVLSSSWWRLSAALVAVLVGQAVRGGTWCQQCSATCMPERVIGTCRLEEVPDAV